MASIRCAFGWHDWRDHNGMMPPDAIIGDMSWMLREQVFTCSRCQQTKTLGEFFARH